MSSSGYDPEKIEPLIIFGLVCGFSMLLLSALFGSRARSAGGKIAKLFIEIQRKSFHMICGSLLAVVYHWGMKLGYLSSAFALDPPKAGTLDAAVLYFGTTILTWIIEFARLQVPSVREWYVTTFRGLIRQKELNRAAGHAYFLPGVLAAMMAAPPPIAILGILMLSIGDAGSSLGTAVGVIPVAASPRRVEGSIFCLAICFAMTSFMGMTTAVGAITSIVVTVGEVIAEVIELDDNLVLPMFCVIGYRIAHMDPMVFVILATGMGISFVCGLPIASIVARSSR